MQVFVTGTLVRQLLAIRRPPGAPPPPAKVAAQVSSCGQLPLSLGGQPPAGPARIGHDVRPDHGVGGESVDQDAGPVGMAPVPRGRRLTTCTRPAGPPVPRPGGKRRRQGPPARCRRPYGGLGQGRPRQRHVVRCLQEAIEFAVGPCLPKVREVMHPTGGGCLLRAGPPGPIRKVVPATQTLPCRGRPGVY